MNSYGVSVANLQANGLLEQNNIPKIDKNAENVALKEQTDAFEAMLLKMIMDNAAKNEKNIFSDQNDPGEKIYKSMYRDELTKASAGGFGFSQMLYDFLSERS
jgi:hypothetical protein